MKKITSYFYLSTLIFLSACGQPSTENKGATTDTLAKTVKDTSVKQAPLSDKTVKFLWRANKYDESIKDSVSSIFIDEAFCKTITDPERAALGYVATFIGNECWWDGEANADRSNLKCKILTALNLGYQCSAQHLGFLRQWFKGDKNPLKELENCPTTPYTATIQDTFDEITLTVRGDKISVFFKANGVNIREGNSWSWTETNHFLVENDCIKLIEKVKSPVKQNQGKPGE
ncbi:MAG: hypothetical protein EOO42_10990 [Flavobacteriales bacterium]|nr:MAG: hypothetical protein EOO42_10990 [Flavobacteriales bacterium]